MNDKHNIVVKLISSSLSIAILTALAYFWGQLLRSFSFPDEAGISPDLLSNLQNEEFLLLGAQLGIVTMLSCFVLWKLLFWGFERFPKMVQNNIVTHVRDTLKMILTGHPVSRTNILDFSRHFFGDRLPSGGCYGQVKRKGHYECGNICKQRNVNSSGCWIT